MRCGHLRALAQRPLGENRGHLPRRVSTHRRRWLIAHRDASTRVDIDPVPDESEIRLRLEDV